VEHFESELKALARELAEVAAFTRDRTVACRLAEMANEVLNLAAPDPSDTPIYHSAIFVPHTEVANNSADPYADDHSTRPPQRH
jgi:hypothetical protein